MLELLSRLSELIEVGKINKITPYPPELRGMDGAVEVTQAALSSGIKPIIILNEGLLPGMRNIGEKFGRGEAFIPNMLIAAKAMEKCMVLLRPFFETGDVISKGTLVIGTVKGDLHDIGKNLVKMVMKGNGWDIVDLGTDVESEKFCEAVIENKNCVVGLSALLTTTMLNMEIVVKDVKQINPATKIFIGGAPVSQNFAVQIGADGYFRDPHSFANYFNG